MRSVRLMAVARPQFVFSTDRRGWLAVGGVAGLLTLAMIVENLTFPTGGAVTRFIVASMALTAIACLVSYPLPFVGLGVAAGLGAANVLVPGMPHGGGTELITLLFLVGFLAFRLPGRWSLGGWLVAALSVGLSVAVTGGEVFEVLFYLLFTGPAWAVGVLLQRERRRSAELAALAAELAEEREHRTASAIAAERSRIARELHDAVAHSVSVMTLQVGVVRRRLDALPTERDTLKQAEQLGRQSVEELRRIVGLVRPAAPDLAPLPSLVQLEDLVSSVRSAGAAVALTRRGDLSDLPSAVDMSAYRIVQEALTNALKHAPESAVAVSVEQRADALVIEVGNDGPGPTTRPRPGNGLTGMTERVTVLGGDLTYGPGPDSGFRVRATLPLVDDQSPVAAR